MALRCFIAVHVPDEIRESIGTVIGALASTGADVKWVKPGNIHITLKFLGSTEEGLVERISGAVQKKISSRSPFYIKIAGTGYFPDRKRPRVIWIGISEAGDLGPLQKEIDEVAARFGYAPEERPFSPHLTIGRVRSGKKVKEMMELLERYSGRDFGTVEIKGVSLMKSELKPEGAEHSSLAEILFAGRITG